MGINKLRNIIIHLKKQGGGVKYKLYKYLLLHSKIIMLII